MKIVKVDRAARDDFEKLRAARCQKNEATTSEKTIKARLALPDEPCGFTFDGEIVATQSESYRAGTDLEKLASDFPKAFEACQVQNRILTLKVTL